MKYIICIFILLIPVYFLSFKEKNKDNIKKVSQEIEKEIAIILTAEDDTISINLEDYIVGVVACEMPASFHVEALKAQAVASRTFALEKNKNKEGNIEISTTEQCYNSIKEMQKKWAASYNLYYNKIKNAVFDTSKEVITYQDKIIKSYYFSTSNGYTENVQNVFGEEKEYLVSVSSPWDKESSTYEKEFILEKEEFLKLLDLKNNENITIEINEKSETGRINYLTINDKKFKGTTLRKLLGIRSTDAQITIEDEVKIITKGYGHGVGMSQYGANGMAKDGYNYKDILKYYYKNTEISNV